MLLVSPLSSSVVASLSSKSFIIKRTIREKQKQKKEMRSGLNREEMMFCIADVLISLYKLYIFQIIMLNF